MTHGERNLRVDEVTAEIGMTCGWCHIILD
jgi:hypothetical protein